MTGRTYELRLHLLDRQVVDRDGRLVAKVDDLELTAGEDGTLYVTAIECGAMALGRRLGGRLGWWLEAAARRLSRDPDPRPGRIDMSLVRDIGSAITLDVRRDQLDVAPLEQWVDTHLIGRIPGADHAGE